MFDILIRNGHMVDTAAKVNEKRTIALKGRRIVKVEDENCCEAEQVINAEGCYVFPGLIDYHSHVFHSLGEATYPDQMIPTGVTTSVDAGTAGCATYDAFHRSTIAVCQQRIKSFLNVYGGGLVDGNVLEILEPERFKPDNIKRIFDKYDGEIVGIKIRMTRKTAKDISPLIETIRIAEELKTRISVHTTDSPVPVTDIASLLRPGDIFAHVYQGTENSILDSGRKVRREIREARKRGVLFDVANGRRNFDIETAIAAFRDDFRPDIISTDQGREKMHYYTTAKNLPYIMSKFMQFGMSLEELIRATTEIPAKLMGEEGVLGTLQPGALADIAVFKIIDQKSRHIDWKGTELISDKLLIPQCTVIDGELAFCQMDFNNAQ